MRDFTTGGKPFGALAPRFATVGLPVGGSLARSLDRLGHAGDRSRGSRPREIVRGLQIEPVFRRLAEGAAQYPCGFGSDAAFSVNDLADSLHGHAGSPVERRLRYPDLVEHLSQKLARMGCDSPGKPLV